MRLLPALLLCLATSAGAEPKPPEAPPAETKNYTVTSTLEPQAATVGQPAKYSITITPQAPWVMKSETPFSAVLNVPQGVSAEKAKLDAKDFVDAKAPAKTVGTSLTASAAGTYVVSADVTFFVCSTEVCKRQKERVTLQWVAR